MSDYEAGRELNELIATKVLGYPKPVYTHSGGHMTRIEGKGWYCQPTYEHGDVCEWLPYPYSDDIAAAFEVLEKFDRREWDITIASDTQDEGKYWSVSLEHYPGPDRYATGEAASLPLAICIAALKAVEA